MNLRMNQEFQDYFQSLLTRFEDQLPQAFPRLAPEAAKLEESARYSLMAGGKRIRPILLLSVLEAAGRPLESGMAFANAIEFIHSYSLIHDDLPCMDDDELRRGKPTNHIVYGENIALLAGDSLLTEAFRLTSDPARSPGVTPEQMLRSIQVLSTKAGNFGMVAGQAADILAEQGQGSAELLRYIHLNKTSMLITASLEIGGILAGLEEEALAHLINFGLEIGTCFQIQDDILDVTATSEQLGKPAGSDERNEKLTYPSLFGLERSKELAEQSYQKALTELELTGLETDKLKSLADFILKRDH